MLPVELGAVTLQTTGLAMLGRVCQFQHTESKHLTLTLPIDVVPEVTD